MCGVACPILDEFSGGFCHLCLHILVRVVSMFLQQLSNLIDLPWSKAKVALYLRSIAVGCLPFVAVIFGALVIVAIIVVVVTLSTIDGLLLIGSLIDFH